MESRNAAATPTPAEPTLDSSTAQWHLVPFLGMLGLLFANNVTMAALAGAVLPTNFLQLFGYSILHAIATAQPVLLAMWAVFVQQSPLLRNVGPLVLLGLLIVLPFAVLPGLAERVKFLPTYGAYQVMLFALAGIVFVVYRGLFRWRIARKVASSADHSQFGMRTLFYLIWLSALAMGAMKVYGEALNSVLPVLLRDSWHCLTALALMAFILPERRRVRFENQVAGALALDLLVTTLLVPTPFDSITPWLMFATGYFGVIALSLWTARRAGFRLTGRYDGRAID